MSEKQAEILENAFLYLSNPSQWDDEFFHNIVVFGRDIELFFNKNVATQYRSLAISLYDSI